MKKLSNRINILLIVVIVCAVAGVVWMFYGSSLDEEESSIEVNTGFAQAQRLAGKWVRPDGGYMLVIEDIKADGNLKASYFNPGNINVHESNWKFEDERLHLFIELRDINYPGCTYTLLYVKEQDVLTGSYFQAAQQQTYEIKFIRFIENPEE